jgi:hypothetical protein
MLEFLPISDQPTARAILKNLAALEKNVRNDKKGFEAFALILALSY